MQFTGFPEGLFTFLGELAAHNERPWFEANKDRYESLVRGPARAFVRAMGERLPEVAPRLRADDRKVGGSLLRIQRDTRFSKDKTPYKTNVGIQFRHEAGKDVHAVGLYVHLDPEEVFVGLGVYAPEPPLLAQIRRAIVDDPERWAAVTAGLDRRMEGALQRVPRGLPADHPFADDLRQRSHFASWRPDRDRIATAAFVDEVLARVCEALGQPW